VEEVVSYFRSLGVSQVDTLEAAQEEVRFSLPAALKQEPR